MPSATRSGAAANWGRGDVDINVNRYNNINVNNRIEGGGNRSNWSHNTDHRKTSYRGGEGQRQNLQNKAASTNRQQYRGKEGGASRDASRAQAQQAMQQRGVDPGSGSARERAQSVDRSQVDRASAQQRAQNVDRGAAQQRAQNAGPQRGPAAGTVGLARQRDAWCRQPPGTGAAGPRRSRAMHPRSVRRVVAHVPPVMAVAAVVARGRAAAAAVVVARVREVAVAAEVRALVEAAAAAVVAAVAVADVVDNGSAWT